MRSRSAECIVAFSLLLGCAPKGEVRGTAAPEPTPRAPAFLACDRGCRVDFTELGSGDTRIRVGSAGAEHVAELSVEGSARANAIAAELQAMSLEAVYGCAACVDGAPYTVALPAVDGKAPRQVEFDPNHLADVGDANVRNTLQTLVDFVATVEAAASKGTESPLLLTN